MTSHHFWSFLSLWQGAQRLRFRSARELVAAGVTWLELADVMAWMKKKEDEQQSARQVACVEA